MRKSNKLAVLIFCFLIFCPLFGVSAETEGYIVKLKNENIPAELTQLLTEVNSKHGLYTVEDISVLDGFDEYIEYTEENSEVILIDDVPGVSLLTLPDDEYYSEQWQTQMVNADYAWEMETYGNEVNVAVIDSGCNQHEDINLAGGYYFASNSDDYSDTDGHGTHVAGIISAQHNSIGVAGVAPKVNLYALKCSHIDDVIAAIYAAVDTYNCKVINMSLDVVNIASLYNAVKYATDSGVIVVAAAGNGGADSSEYKRTRLCYPAGYDEVIGVGSVGAAKTRSSFSQQNDSVFVVAPGEDYKSTVGTDSYVKKSGTSQATPVVSAAAAILFSVDEDMTVEEFKNYIISCSEKLEDNSFCGYGLLNIEAMFKACIANTDYYISPINSDGVLIYNNTESTLSAIGMFAEFKNNLYTAGSMKEIILLPDKKMKINYYGSGGNMRFFLWSSLKNLYPLAEVRTAETAK